MSDLKLKRAAQEAAEMSTITDRWGAVTGACEQSFTQGAEWGYRQAISDASEEAKTQSDIYFDKMENSDEPYFSQHYSATRSLMAVKSRICRLLRKLEK